MHDIASAEMEDIDVTIKLANRDTIKPFGIVRDVEVLCGKVKYPADFFCSWLLYLTPYHRRTCVKSFMDTDAFRGFRAKYGLDSEIVASFCESFAAHIDLPKDKWFKYNPPIEVKVVAPITVEEKTITYNDPIVPTTYVEKPPFPVG